MSQVAERIHSKLVAALAPERLEVVDQSAKHAGHSGSREGGETHFDVLIVSQAFAGKSRLVRQREVHAALKAELDGPVHALAIKALAPGE